MENKYHYKDVEIADEMITAEYFEMTNEADDNNGNFLTRLYYALPSLSYIRRKIKDIYYEVKYGFQRMFRGYDDGNLFSIYNRFVYRYSKIIPEFKKNQHGHPWNMTEQQWEDILDQMSLHLYYMDRDNVDKELMKSVPKNWFPTCKTSGEIMKKHKDAFFELFVKYFYDLWD